MRSGLKANKPLNSVDIVGNQAAGWYNEIGGLNDYEPAIVQRLKREGKVSDALLAYTGTGGRLQSQKRQDNRGSEQQPGCGDSQTGEGGVSPNDDAGGTGPALSPGPQGGHVGQTSQRRGLTPGTPGTPVSGNISPGSTFPASSSAPENNGGDGKPLALTRKTLFALTKKFDPDGLQLVLEESGLVSSIGHLTEAQGQFILGHPSPTTRCWAA